jgi:UPF0716 protein FxsA
MRRPFLRYAALYVLVELAVFALLVWAVGLGWALVVAAAAFMAGLLLAASQLKGQVAAVRRARRNPHGAVTDGVLVGLGSALVLLPGIVSTAVGALMLAPPTRTAMRPLASTMLTRGVARRMAALNVDQFVGPVVGPIVEAQTRRGDYIDGEVIEEPRAAIARRGI